MYILYDQAGFQTTDYPVGARIPKSKSFVHIIRSRVIPPSVSNPTRLASPALADEFVTQEAALLSSRPREG